MAPSKSSHILPPKNRGIIIHLSGIFINFGLLIVLLIQISQIEIGPLFVFFLLLFVVLILLIILLSYRLFSLIQAEYSITREGIFLKWGFREQFIPMSEVNWIRVEGDLSAPISFPALSWTGSTHGISIHEDLGDIEYMYSSLQNITLIGTNEKTYIISPENQNLFLQQFQRALEHGILGEANEISVFPNFLLVEIWKLSAARYFLFPAITFSLALFVWVGFSIQNYDHVSLGFSASGAPLVEVPGIQLILLPAINFLVLVFSVWVATFFYRHDEKHPVIPMLFLANAITSFVFLIALFQILTIS